MGKNLTERERERNSLLIHALNPKTGAKDAVTVGYRD